MRAWLALVGCAAFCLGAPPVVADPGPTAQSDQPEKTSSAIDQRIIVQWRPGAAPADRAAARASAGATDAVGLGGHRFQVLTLAADQRTGDALGALRANPDVALATRDGYSELHATQPNDPLFGLLWGLRNTGAGVGGFGAAVPGADINALSAWGKTVGDSSVIVADLDTGYRPNHPDLSAPLWTNSADPYDGLDNDGNGIADDTHGADFAGADVDLPTITPDGDPTDDIYLGGHGVHTAGTIAAQGDNALGITGVAQRVTLLPVRVCGYSPSANANNGGIMCPFSAQVAGINYAGSHGARVANMSLGGTSSNLAVRAALAANPNTLFVISAGNSGQNIELAGQTTYPCSYDPRDSGSAVDNVVCVAATDQADAVASFSNWGKTKVDLAAPGTEIVSTWPAHRYPLDEGFETAGWPYSGWTAGGFTRTNALPLTGYGITNNTPTQANASTRTAISPTVTVPWPTVCRLYQNRQVEFSGSDDYSYSIFKDGVPLDGRTITNSSSDGLKFLEFPVSGAGPHSLQVRFSYTREGGVNTSGVWLEEVWFECPTPPGAEGPDDYGFLEGTSMAAPHVTGAAALLAAYEPTASVAQLRQALLAGVDPLPDLNPTTGTHPVATGGRLDADSSLAKVDSYVAPNTAFTQQSAVWASATFTFAAADTRAAATFECGLDGAGLAPCTSPVSFTGLTGGQHTFTVRARDGYGNVDASPAVATWTAGAPGKVTGLKIKRKARSATVRWQPVPGADGYRIRWTKGGKKYGSWVSLTRTTKKITRLQPGRKYRVQVVSFNSAGASMKVTATVKAR